MARHHLALLLVSLTLVACAPEAPETPRGTPSRIAGEDRAAEAARDASLRSLPAQQQGAAPGERRSVDPRPVPAGHVAVTVIDHDGVPVSGIDVIGFDLDDAGEPPHRIRFTFAEATGTDGRAFLPPRRQGMRYAAALFDGSPAVSTEEDPTRIALPPCGSLRVDQSGHPGATRLRVQSVRDGRPLTFRAGSLPGGRIDLLPVGVRLELGSIGPLEAVTATIAGPAEPGEVVEWRPRPSPRLRIRARLVGADGAPLAGMSATLWRNRGSLVLRSVDRASGAVSGELLLEHWDLEPGETAIVREFDGDRLDAGLLEGAVRAPAVEDERAVDLGDVELLPHPLVTAGRVVDASGEPVSGVDVRLRWRPEHRRVPAALGYAHGTAGDLERMDRGGAPFASLDVTDLDGRFELRSREPLTAVDAAQVHIEAREPGRDGAVAQLAVELGRADVEIVLRSPGRVRVGLDAVPLSLRSGLRVRLRRTDGPGAPITTAPPPHGHMPHAFIEAVAPEGVYDVEVVLWNVDMRSAPDLAIEETIDALLVIEDVVVPAGAASRDPRLDRIELPVRSARLVCPGGEPLSELSIDASAEHPHGWSSPVTAVDRATGVVTWLATGARGHTKVAVEGHFPVDLAAVEDGAVVVLKPLECIEVTFEGAAPPLERVIVDFLPIVNGPTGPPHHGMDCPRRSDGAWRIALARGETYRLELRRRSRAPAPWADPAVERSSADARERWHGVEFTVPSSGGPVVVRAN